MKRDYSFLLSMGMVFAALVCLLVYPEAAAAGAKNGLAVCAVSIIPALFPFMVVCSALIALGLPRALISLSEPLARRLFGVSGYGAAAFLLGLIGGYPLGASVVSEMYRSGSLSRREAQRLSAFCDNCGPGFIVSVAGVSVFGLPSVGLFLYGVHILSALSTGMLLRLPVSDRTGYSPPPHPPLAGVFTESVRRSALTCLTVCGFVVFFSTSTGLLTALGALPALAGRLSALTGAELHFSYSLLTGLLELGTGIVSMAGLSPTAVNLALCAFLLGWGGLSVQAQAAAITEQSGLSAGPHLLGKLLHGFLSALLSLLLYPIFF